MRPSWLLLLPLTLLGCPKDKAPSDASASAESEPDAADPVEAEPSGTEDEDPSEMAAVPALEREPPPGTSGRMYRHWDLATRSLMGVVSGNLDDTTRYATALENLEPAEDLPDAWRPLLAEMHGAAARVAQSKDIPEAAANVAAMGTSCATCHEAVGHGPDVPELPEQDWEEAQHHMAKHHWAAHWMWLSVITPSESAWDTGLDAIVESDLMPGGEDDAMEQKVHELAKEAKEAKDGIERSKHLGTFLTTCAECHTALEVELPFNKEEDPLSDEE